MRRTLWFVTVLWACGGGGSPAPQQPECSRDQDCDDANECTRDFCAPSVGGVRRCQNEPNDSLCAPGERCVVGVSGLSGCRPEAVVVCLGLKEGASCEVSDPCAAGPGTCRSGRCEYKQKTCPDRACHASLGCDPASGECRYEALPDGTSCVLDVDPCRPARCRAGECRSTDAPLCDDGDSCTQDICSENVCEHQTLPDGTPCDDSDPCTVGETCVNGICGGGKPRDCDDHNDCTVDFCVPANGVCAFELVADGAACFAGGNRCRQGTCRDGICEDVKDLVCDDKDPCTKDYCDTKSGCRHDAQSNIPCDDGDKCTEGDICLGGQCRPGSQKVCNDFDTCTQDSCDLSKGCVFAPITPCCGNRIVEDVEQCDGGPAGTQGCDSECRYRVVTLTALPTGGRFASVAWSETSGSGLVAYEAAPAGRVLVARRVGSDISVGPERLVWDYKVTPVHDLSLVSMPATPSVSLVAVARPVHVDLFTLDQDGARLKSYPEAWPMWAMDLDFGRVRIGPMGPARALVAWQDAVFCPGMGGVPVVRVGQADLSSGTFEPAVQVGPGSCDPWHPTVLGDACGTSKGGIFTLSERQTGVPGAGKVVRHMVLPYDSVSMGMPTVVAEVRGDLVQPPACAAAADAQSFLVLYWDLDAVTGALRVRSLLTAQKGGLLGGPWTLQEVQPADFATTPICLPLLSGASGLTDGRFVVVCAMVVYGQNTIEASSLHWRLLGPDGKPVEGFSPLGIEAKPLAYDVRLASGPRGDVLAAWYETDVFDPMKGFAASPGWLKLFVLGKGAYW